MACSSAAAFALRIGLAQIPQQKRELVATEPADHVGGAHLRGSVAATAFST